MSRARPLEVKALLPLLEQDWETPEDLATALIFELDETRAGRTSYVAVMQLFGVDGSVPIYTGIGPFPGRKSAEAAVKRHPAAPMATKVVVIPILTGEGFEKMLREVA